MDEHMIINSLNELDDSFNESIDDSDTDLLFRIESESNSDFQDSSEDEDQNHSTSVLYNVQSGWNTVSGDNEIEMLNKCKVHKEYQEVVDFRLGSQ